MNLFFKNAKQKQKNKRPNNINSTRLTKKNDNNDLYLDNNQQE